MVPVEACRAWPLGARFREPRRAGWAGCVRARCAAGSRPRRGAGRAEQTPPLRWHACLLLVWLTGAPAGCRPVETRFEVVSFRDRTRPETLTQRFPPGSFCRNMQSVIEIALALPTARLEALSGEGAANREVPIPGDTGELAEPDASDRAPATAQIIRIEMLWHPLPGTTYAERTQTNATIRYALRTGEGAISYEGAGFVYFERSRDGGSMEGRIESSTLRPTRWTSKDLDFLGPCRLTGTFTATESRRAVASIQQTFDRWFARLPPSGGPG